MAAFLFVAVSAARIAVSFAAAPAVHVMGDRAPELSALLGGGVADDGDISVVVVNGWGSLRHLPDMRARCGVLCGEAGQVTLLELRPARSRKILLFDLRAFPAGLSCIAERIEAERVSLRSQGPPCGQAIRAVLVDLPYGLGQFRWPI